MYQAKTSGPRWDGTSIVMIDRDYRPESLRKHGSYDLLANEPNHQRVRPVTDVPQAPRQLSLLPKKRKKYWNLRLLK